MKKNVEFQINRLKNLIKKKVKDTKNNKIKISPQKFNPKKYLDYFLKECQKREEENTKASTTMDGQIHYTVFKKKI